MNDFFILLDREISFCDFELLLQEISDCEVIPYATSGIIQVWYKGKHIDFTLMRVTDFMCERDQAFIEINDVKTVYMISCSKHSECELNSLLSVLANSIDGWIGQDSEGFSPATKL